MNKLLAPFRLDHNTTQKIGFAFLRLVAFATILPIIVIIGMLLYQGASAIDVGLADGLGSLEWVAREVVKAEQIVDFTEKQNLAERFARRFGAVMAESLSRVLVSGDFSLR